MALPNSTGSLMRHLRSASPGFQTTSRYISRWQSQARLPIRIFVHRSAGWYRRQGRLRVTGGKAPSEDMYSGLGQLADIARSAFHYSVNVLRITRSASEQFHAWLWPINATRLSGMEWLCSAKKA